MMIGCPSCQKLIAAGMLCLCLGSEMLSSGNDHAPERVIVRETVHFEDHSRLARLELRHPNLFQEPVVDIERLSDERRSQLGGVKVEKDAIGIVDAAGFKFDILLHVDRHSRVIRRGPMADTRHPGQLFALAFLVRSSLRSFALFRVGVAASLGLACLA